MIKKHLKNNDILFFIGYLVIFYSLFGFTLKFGKTFDDYMLVSKFFNSPGDAKLYSSHLYADFHFYPLYFLSHEIDKFFTYFYAITFKPIPITFIQKNTNFLLHIFNAYLIFVILKILFSPNTLLEKLLLYFSSLIFLFHPIGSQIIFNITTRNESLSLFFSLLTFIYSFKFYENKKIINLFFIVTLYFFSLSSKLISVTFLAIIPAAIFFFKFERKFDLNNIKRIIIIFSALFITFLIFYFIRSNFVNEYDLVFYNNLNQIISNSLVGLKFYLRGLFYPFEHIYIFADNYNKKFIFIIFWLCLFVIFFSIYFFYKKKDPSLIFVIIWLSSTLSVPLLFNLIDTGFPLISKLAERYQYFSIPALSILSAGIFMRFFNMRYAKLISILTLCSICLFSILIMKDRSVVYKDNTNFFYKAYENSPDNYHSYFFSVPLNDAIREQNEKKFLFYLYQLFNLYPYEAEYIFQFMGHFNYTKNKFGYDYFLKYYKEKTPYNPPLKFKLAEYFYTNKKYNEAEVVINEIFKDFDKLIENYKNQPVMIRFIKPEIDDVYFLKGLIMYNQNRLNESLGSFMMATLHNPLHATALYNSSIILKKFGQHELAKKHFEDAIKLNPFLRETINQVTLNEDSSN